MSTEVVQRSGQPWQHSKSVKRWGIKKLGNKQSLKESTSKARWNMSPEQPGLTSQAALLGAGGWTC